MSNLQIILHYLNKVNNSTDSTPSPLRDFVGRVNTHFRTTKFNDPLTGFSFFLINLLTHKILLSIC